MSVVATAVVETEGYGQKLREKWKLERNVGGEPVFECRLLPEEGSQQIHRFRDVPLEAVPREAVEELYQQLRQSAGALEPRLAEEADA